MLLFGTSLSIRVKEAECSELTGWCDTAPTSQQEALDPNS